jgi:hypothetical protein
MIKDPIDHYKNRKYVFHFTISPPVGGKKSFCCYPLGDFRALIPVQLLKFMRLRDFGVGDLDRNYAYYLKFIGCT